MVQVSFAPTCLLHDLRKPSAILHTLSGHVAPHLSRSKAIYHPHFVDGGKGLLVTGEVRSEPSWKRLAVESGSRIADGLFN